MTGARGVRLWRWLSIAAATATLALGATLLPHLADSAELVRMRNALLLDALPAEVEWTPDTVPPDFRRDSVPPDPLYARAVADNALVVVDDDWATALRIGRHLLQAGGKGGGRPIQSDMDDTYRRIVDLGEGYCGDYADSFTGLANAAGLFTRPWAFSFDGFGGRGHIFNEVWDRQAGRWRMIDVFNNYYLTDAAGEPLSAMGVRKAFLAGGADLRFELIDPAVRPGYRYPIRAWEFYERGIGEWYMWWGNNVFEYDRSPAVRLLGLGPRALEQLGGIAAGVHPRIRILATGDNQAQREALQSLRARLLAVPVLAACLLLTLAGWWWARRRALVGGRPGGLPATTGHATSATGSSRPAAIAVLTPLFPNQMQPVAGVFIRERMFRVAAQIPLLVIGPQPWFPLQGVIRRFKPDYRPVLPAREIQDGITVLFPRFLSVPGLFRWLDGLSIAVCLWPLLRRLRAESGVGLIDAHFAYPCGYAATLLGRWLGLPVAVTLRGTEVVHVREPRLRKRVVAAAQGADRVFSVSDSLRQLLIAEGVAAERIQVVSNGVDADKFRAIDRQEARRRLGLPAAARVLVSVGGLVPGKGFHRVIDLLPGLRNEFPDLYYVVVGGATVSGDMGAQLREQVNRLGLEDHVRFTGPLPPEGLHVPLSAADVFVLATEREGWANVLLEAMACGLPVVTTAVGGNAEVVSSSELGTLVPFGDGEALRLALADALRRDWDHERIVAYARHNGWDERVAVLVGQFRDMLASVAEPATLTTGAARNAHS